MLAELADEATTFVTEAVGSTGASVDGLVLETERWAYMRYAGQGFRLGRYPVHIHMVGAVRNSYVRKNSIHHTYNRAVAIHGVHYLRVQDNGGLRH